METAPNEQLESLVEEGRTHRLSPAKEDQVIAILKEKVLSGRTGIAEALEVAIQLSWGICVKVVTDTWPELKESARRLIVTSLNVHKTEQGRRIRMSVARGLFPIEPAVTLKMMASICDELLNSPPEAITQKDRQSFGNVFIGKGKPWLNQLDLGGLRPGEATRIAQCAAMACFPREVSPFTQLCLVRWIASTGRLAKLPEETLAAIADGVQRWQPKFRNELARETTELPPAIVEALGRREEPDHTGDAPAEEQPETSGAAAPQDDAPAQTEEPAPQKSPRGRDRPARSERGIAERNNRGGFDFTRTIQDLQRYVGGLERELAETREKLRRGAESPRRGRRTIRGEETVAPEDLEKELDSQKRYNAQLESRVEELNRQLTDFTSEHEELASSLGAGSDEPVTDPREQFRITLGVKLRHDFEEFEAIEREPADEVFREHYRIILKSVFETLESCGVSAKRAEE